ncbi:DegT/DnrJ/EryC1/StrS family aminotransferase [Shimia marina]|uniref:L-glutamine:2-deoxy-scyllo-inosose aminotransferase n=1 Tax=Shimia marina TaxID=321267 RepID=A0A0P1ER75_9RHOB|nr:aminotransferase class I/II-fold pyridoxal phosphate-dependent enzyme [Shimia marina]CUH52777.1 L-glutamine:2-deoxy-scyllo-inosose aminotransferase [Shimia marina]SFD87614.1 dTDP-4-amino-4,6-dideoxygalactose transaminase [Shimia marina]
MSDVFTGNFTQQESISEEAIEAAVAVLRSGRLHRYNLTEGEVGETSLLEREFAAYVGAKYCLAVASGGYAMGCALRAMGVEPGDKVLTNAFTLAPVPGAIASVGAVPVFVGVTEDLVIDLEDLKAKADQADVLMLSHMRGHICDMEALMALCDATGVRVVEDCAHTMGGAWKSTASGRWGRMACYSTQTYKHMNSGEGGLLISDDPELMARATMLSGSYMLYGRNGAVPEAEVFEAVKYDTPNVSGRMDHLRAAILRPQLRNLDHQVAAWNVRHDVILQELRGTPGLTVVERAEHEHYVGSSIQFLLLDWTEHDIHEALARCAARGVELKWFGGAEPVAFTSRYDSWRYAPSAPMPKTDRILKGIVDMRIPLTFSVEDCAFIAQIIRAEVGAVFQGQKGTV